MIERPCASDAYFETMIGTSSWVDSLFVFPAAWMPLVVEAIRWKTIWWSGRGRHQGAVARTDASHTRIPDNKEFRLKRWQVDRRGQSPVLHARANVDCLTLDPEVFASFFPRRYDGILQDTFNQKASMAWHPAPTSHLVVSLLLPGSLEAEEWLILARRKRHVWPMQMTSHAVAANLPTEQFMQRERRRLKAGQTSS